MKLPTKINVKGAMYTIKSINNMMCDDHHDLCDGMVNTDEKWIVVNTKSRIGGKHILLHEIIHALIFELGLSQLISEDLDEILAENISNELQKIFYMRFKRLV
jgi:hypothetical protein